MEGKANRFVYTAPDGAEHTSQTSARAAKTTAPAAAAPTSADALREAAAAEGVIDVALDATLDALSQPAAPPPEAGAGFDEGTWDALDAGAAAAAAAPVPRRLKRKRARSEWGRMPPMARAMWLLKPHQRGAHPTDTALAFFGNRRRKKAKKQRTAAAAAVPVRPPVPNTAATTALLMEDVERAFEEAEEALMYKDEAAMLGAFKAAERRIAASQKALEETLPLEDSLVEATLLEDVANPPTPIRAAEAEVKESGLTQSVQKHLTGFLQGLRKRRDAEVEGYIAVRKRKRRWRHWPGGLHPVRAWWHHL